MSKLKDRVVVITGASSGIGAALARQCAKEGASVVLAARRKERLDALTAEVKALGGKALAVVCDVSSEADVKNMIGASVKQFSRIDILVNNAGHGLFGPVQKIPPDEIRRVFSVNFFGMFYCCREVIPVMKEQGSGHIINISSIAGVMALPLSSAYNATKFAMNGFSDSMRRELKSSGIDVSVIYPGSTETEFYDNQVNVHTEAVRKQSKLLYQKTDDVARAIVKCMRSPKAHVVPAFPMRVAIFVNRLCPWAIDLAMKLFPSIFDVTKK